MLSANELVELFLSTDTEMHVWGNLYDLREAVATMYHKGLAYPPSIRPMLTSDIIGWRVCDLLEQPQAWQEYRRMERI